MLPEWLQNIINGATSTTVTGGSLAVLSYFLLTSGRIHTRGQVERLNAEHDKALELQKQQYENRIAELIALKDESRQVVTNQLTQALTDKKVLQDALDLERSAKDAIASKVMTEIVPLIQVTNKHLDGIEELAKGGDPQT